MARTLKSYYLVKRRDRLTDGRPTYYLRVRDADGQLPPGSGVSTGCTSKGAAERFAAERLKDGPILGREGTTLATFGRDFWVEDGAYVKARRARGRRLSPVYLQALTGYFKNHIDPTLGAIRLTDLSPRRIDDWLVGLLDDGLSPTTANRCRGALAILLAEAVRARLLSGNPCDGVEELAEHRARRGTLELAEVRRLFAERTIGRVWSGDRTAFTLHLFLAATGARLGEALALLVGNVHSEHVVLSHSWDRKAGLKEGSKSGPGRALPIPERVAKHLGAQIEGLPWREPADLVFVRPDHRGEPLAFTAVGQALYRALERIGIDDEQRRERRIVTHSWRHFLNTALRAAKTPDALVRRTVGHAAGSSMTEHYTSFHLEDYAPVLAVQRKILG